MGLVAAENDLLHWDGRANVILNGSDHILWFHIFLKKFTICNSVFCHNRHVQ